MKKTLKFDDGSILVGSSSTFTVTQEDQGKLDIFDMPSKYIWIISRGILDGYDEREGNTYYGITVESGGKRYTLTVEDLQPFKYDNIKCKVIERTGTVSPVLKLTNTDGSITYSLDPYCRNNLDVQKIEALQELDTVDIDDCNSLTDVSLIGNITGKMIIRNCSKLTNITCDRPIKPNSISITNNPKLLSVPTFKSGVYNNMKAAFKGCRKLDIDTSVFQLSGDCSEAFMNTGITRLVINDAGITNMKDFASTEYFTETLQEVVINGTLNKCEDFNSAFAHNLALKKCDMSGVNFENVLRLQSMFNFCQQLKTVGINYATIGNNLNNVSLMFEQSGITDDIVFTGSADNFRYFYMLCSSYTKKLVLPADKPSKMSDLSYGKVLNNATSLEYLKWDNIGNKENQTAFDFTANTKLGTGSDENLQAFKNLFINAFDRKTAGYAVCTVRLADAQKALLTAEEITAFENKGYKIA